MNREKYQDDLQEIREIMDRSAKSRSVSGLSGILAGIFALAGVFLINTRLPGDLSYDRSLLNGSDLQHLLLVATSTLLLSLGATVVFGARNSQKQGRKLWDAPTRRVFTHLAIPLGSGGLVCLILLLRGHLGLAIPLSILFYGLALVNGSKYTYQELFVLGIGEILLGIWAMVYPSWGLIIWAVGFGGLNILVGLILYMKHKS